MLTSDLLRVRRRQGEVLPRYLAAQQRERLLPVAEALIAVLEQGQGEPRDALLAALDDVPYPTQDRIVVSGLRKLLLDRCEFALEPGPDPAELREAVFVAAAAHRRSLGPRDGFARDGLLAEQAAALDLGVDILEARLFADLRGNEQLISHRLPDGPALLERYDVALAQAVLLQATKVTVTLEGERAARVRQLFRSARFHGLLHVVRGDPKTGYVIELDGPLSLFSAMRRYGLRLALFLPAVLRCRSWKLEAELLWGRDREPMVFRLDPTRGLVATGRPTTGSATGLEQFRAAFAKLASSWKVKRSERIFATPGEVACVPDLVFHNTETGEEVYLEAFGFWSRQAVWQRVEAIRRGAFPGRIILAVGKQLRVSEEVLTAKEGGGELYVYRATMSPRAVLKRLDASG